jgi:hypothetical protein
MPDKGREILKRFFTDEEISGMSPEQKAAIIKEAEGHGYVDLDKAPVPTRQNTEWGSVLLLGCILAGVGYWIISAWTNKPAQPEPWPVGFEELIDCSSTSSLDGTKELHLSENSVAVMYDKSKKENGKYRRFNGKWAFNEASKLYTVTLNGEPIAYSIVQPSGWGSCMLVKGDLRSVDLTTAWFAIPSENTGSSDPPEAEITAH